MILSDTNIQKAIDEGRIVIRPYRPECLGSNSYDVHLGRYLATYRDGALDARRSNPVEEFTIPAHGFVLVPGQL
jgi:dCTP deaminase